MRCLESLAGQRRAPDEVVVVVREGDEATRAAVRSAGGSLTPRTATISEPGVVAALTVGLDALDTDVVVITDDDVVASPEWLSRLERHYLIDTSVGAVGGRDHVHELGRALDGAEPDVGLVRWYGRVIGNHHLGAGPARAVDLLKGANMSFRATALDGIRPDPRLLGEGAQAHFELGLCLPLIREGWTVIYDPTIVVEHYPAPRFDEDARRAPSLDAQRHAAHNELYLLLRWLPAWRKPLAFAYALLVGSRRGPGLAILVERLLRERDREDVIRRFRAAQGGRVKALCTACVRPSGDVRSPTPQAARIQR
jgi:Glycosyltransferase like family 2